MENDYHIYSDALDLVFLAHKVIEKEGLPAYLKPPNPIYLRPPDAKKRL